MLDVAGRSIPETGFTPFATGQHHATAGQGRALRAFSVMDRPYSDGRNAGVCLSELYGNGNGGSLVVVP